MRTHLARLVLAAAMATAAATAAAGEPWRAQQRPAVATPAAEERLWHLKSNLIGLGMLIVNIEGEVELSRHFSAALPIYYSGFNYFTSSVKFRTFSLFPEVRYRFSGHDGWFVGAHLGLAFYNFATNGHLRTQDRDGNTPALGGGIAAGYRMPLGKGGRWRLECSAGAGVYRLRYDKFVNEHKGRLVRTDSRTYWGLDRVAVSLVYTFKL